MRSLLISGMSFVLTTFVIGNAYIQKKQFYPSVVYITKSNSSMAVIYLQALVFVVLMGKMLRAIFFGQLRAAEMEHLIERSWYAVTETCLAFTVFRDDFSPRFVALFTLLLFLKCFHWLAEDRIDYMERSPAISWLFHIRALSLMLVLSVLDILFVRHAYYSTLLKGPSVQLVFGFEYEILLTVVLMTFIKYILHTIDLQSENPWDNKAMYLLYSELIMGFIRVVLYILFVVVMIKVHTFPLFAIRPMYLTLRAFQKAAQDVILSRRAIRNMNTLYPDASPEELSAGDSVCIICREEMTTACKKLPCNHIFHTSCLRSWFQRQQTCPTCRLEVLRMPRATSQQRQAPQERPQGQPEQPDIQPPAANNPINNMPGMFGGFPFQWPPNAGGQVPPPPFMWPPHQQPMPGQMQPPAQQQQQQPGTPSSETSATSSQSSSTQQQQAQTATSTSSPATEPTSAPSTSLPPFSMSGPGMAFAGMPPFMPPMMPPFFGPIGFPPPPVPLEGLSEEELKVMEGIERTNVEARIHWLRDIQTLLDGAMVLIGQYNSVAGQLGSAGIPSHPVPPFGQQTATSSVSSTSAPSPNSIGQPQQPQPYPWSYGQGARPKYTSPATRTHMSGSGQKTHPNSTSAVTASQDSKTDSAPADVSSENVKSELVNSRTEKEDQELQEVRKRRLEHFRQSTNSERSKSSPSDGVDIHGDSKHDEA